MVFWLSFELIFLGRGRLFCRAVEEGELLLVGLEVAEAVGGVRRGRVRAAGLVIDVDFVSGKT